MKKDFDAVEMVRRIRDAHYEQTKEMTKNGSLFTVSKGGRHRKS